MAWTPGTLGIIGRGMIGSALARLAVAAGLDVVVANSRGPETLADLVVAAVPLKAYDRPPSEALAGQTVIDTMNHHPDRDGSITELDAGALTSGALVRRQLVGARVVKAFNSIDFRRLFTGARPAGDPDRSALPVAGDDVAAKAQVTALLDALGHDAVDIGTLADSWSSRPGTPVYVEPYLGKRPAGLSQEEASCWSFETPGVPTPAGRVKELADRATPEK
ncbi:NADPH-dependent F420 reductase [Streptomyces sp. NPDC001617]